MDNNSPTDDGAIAAWKDAGNRSFQGADYEEACRLYSDGLVAYNERTRSVSAYQNSELKANLLSNRAACRLKLMDFKGGAQDCTEALAISPSSTKALYRRALCHEGLQEYQRSVQDCTMLLQMDPGNAQGQQLMRRLKEVVSREQSDMTEVKRALDLVVRSRTGKTVLKDVDISSVMSSLIGLCYDDKSHALDLYRRDGLDVMVEVINDELAKGDVDRPAHYSSLLLNSIRVLSSSSTHKEFVLRTISFEDYQCMYNKQRNCFEHCHLCFSEKQQQQHQLGMKSKLSFVSICSILFGLSDDMIAPLLVLVMNILKHTPMVVEEASDPPVYSINEHCGRALLCSLHHLLGRRSSDTYAVVADTISAFISDCGDYFQAEVEVDSRLESMEQRRRRIKHVELLKKRSKQHTSWAVEGGILDRLVVNMDSCDRVVRHNSSSCLGKLVNYHGDDVERLKNRLMPHLKGHVSEFDAISEEKQVVELDDLSQEAMISIEQVRIRAALEATLLISNPDLGLWALELPGGISQLHALISTGDHRCQELAAEVICLASSMEAGGKLIKSIISNGALTVLLHAPHPGIRAAAASTLTKLSIKAKAITEDSAEVAQILNTALGVLKEANRARSNALVTVADPKKIPGPESSQQQQQLVSFSALDEVSQRRSQAKKLHDSQLVEQQKQKALLQSVSSAEQSNAVTMTSVERSIETLAAMVGKTYIKEEIVHGSYRVAACIPELMKLDLDARSTAAYGLTHILCALTVTNRELRAKALADKDITPEQFDQLSELQRIKTKDEEGNVIEEKKEEDDMDTAHLCCQRIKRLVSCDAIKFLVKYLSEGSAQTREAAARAMRQICVEPSIRGAVVQQGGLKLCCTIATSDPSTDPEVKKAARLEAAHAVAKTLVTTNPHLLTEHQRLGAVKPLLMLCRDGDATNLQQFECLLSLTNVLSCGEPEHNKFIAEKGISTVHYLVFSEHLMVRRAATETLCNLSSNESFLMFMQNEEKVRLWLGLCEDGCSRSADNDAEAGSSGIPSPSDVDTKQDGSSMSREPYLTARAAAGSLATLSGDSTIADLMIKEDCARTLVALLESTDGDLIHRALVIIIELLSSKENATERYAIAKYLVEGHIVPAMSSSVVASSSQEQLGSLVKDAAQALSDAMGSSSRSDDF